MIKVDADKLKKKRIYSKERKEYVIPVSEVDALVSEFQGEWVDVNVRTIPYNRISKAKKCSNCGKRKDKYVTWNFCPNCGAKMDSVKEGAAE